MALSLAKALTYPPLDQCRVVGGAGGLHHIVSSVNIISAPDSGPWIKGEDLLFTAGYLFKDSPEEQINLIRYLNNQGCAGLAIKFKRYLIEPPEAMTREANALDFPLIEIPYDLSVSDIILSLFKEIVNARRNESERSRNNSFLTRLFRGELQGEDFILAEGRPFGLLPNCDYTVLNITFDLIEDDGYKSRFTNVIAELIQEISATMGLKLLTAETDYVAALLQTIRRKNHNTYEFLAKDVAEVLVEKFSRRYPGISLSIGIGTRQPDVLRISESHEQAQEAIYLGRRVNPTRGGAIYEYEAFDAYSLLELLPSKNREHYIGTTLGKLLVSEKKDYIDLLNTLEVYLNCNGRIAECAKLLHVHRNTVNFRIARIEELLGVNLENGETAFRLQLALHIEKLNRLSTRSL